jgi:hypothetical protein
MTNASIYKRPMIYVVYLWSMGTALPPYCADAEPDVCAIRANPRMTDVRVLEAYFAYD